MKYLKLVIAGAMLFAACSQQSNENQSDTRKIESSAPRALDQWFVGLLHPLQTLRDSAYKAILAETSPQRADSAVAMFRVSYSDAANILNDSLSDNDRFQTWLQEDSSAQSSLEPMLKTLGLSFVQSEGSMYVDISSRDIVAQTEKSISASMRRFLSIRGEEEAEGFSNDAALLIGWDQLSERIVTWEEFIDSNKSFLLLPEAQSWYDVYLRVYFTGMDNTPVFAVEGDTLDQQVRASYSHFMAKHPTSRSATMVRDYLGILTSAGFRETKRSQEYLDSLNIRSMKAIQPPLR